MAPPIDIFAAHWSAFVRGDGGSLDSIFSQAGLRRVMGDSLGGTAPERPAHSHVTVRQFGTPASGAQSFAEDLLAFASRPEPLCGGVRRGVFCPPRLHAGEGSREATARIYRALSEADGGTLYLPEHPRDLEEVALPGPTTLFSPRSPELHVRVVGTAKWIVTYRPLPALAALGAGIPTLWIAVSEESRRLAASWGVKAWTPDEATPERVLEWIAKATPQPLEVPAGHQSEWSRLEAMTSPPAPSQGEPPCFASISSGDYLPFLEGYVGNLIDAHAGKRITVYVLALDEKVEGPLRTRFGDLCDLKLFQLHDFWTQDQMPEIRSRSVGVRAFSTKPLLIRRALLETGRPVFYADSDVYFFSSSIPLIEEFSSSGVLLFPHWNDDFRCSRTDGIFNAGMVVSYASGIPFLDWWSERCWENANYGQGDGVVADQGYLDFGPALFEAVHSYRQGDHDVARWNLFSLGVHWDSSFPPRPYAANGASVKTYHAAFVDSMGLSEVKFAWDSANYFFSPSYVAATPAPLMELVLLQQATHWLTLSRWLRLVQKLGLKGGRRTEWLRRAVGPWGKKVLSWISGPGDRAWSSAAPVLPATSDPWILGHRECFQPDRRPTEIKRRA